MFRFALGSVALIAGCASPSAPKPPSLHLPQPIRDLSLTRSGDDVQISFTLPTRTTDNLPLRSPTLHVTVCRQPTPSGPCTPVDLPQTRSTQAMPQTSETASPVHWRDPLPPDLRGGPPRPLAYRVEVRNDAGRSAGPSDPAFVGAGAAPPRVEALKAEGTRSGILLQWTAAAGAGEILLERTQLNPTETPQHAPARPSVKGPSKAAARTPEPPRAGRSRPSADPATVWLQAEPGNAGAGHTLDGTVVDGTQYRYTAIRRIVRQVGGHTLDLRSTPSTPVEITWRDVYPPATPQGLTALGFETAAGPGRPAATYAVDLIWEPVNDPRVTGYIVRRIRLSATGDPEGALEQLTPEPVPTPAFHDKTAVSSATYRYEVTAVDAKGNASSPATAVVQATGR